MCEFGLVNGEDVGYTSRNMVLFIDNGHCRFLPGLLRNSGHHR